MQNLKYPIGHYVPNKNPSQVTLDRWISSIEHFPAKIEKLLNPYSSEVLSWRYRTQGWSIKQVIHHCADSHLNSIMRFKLALTEDKPTIRPYYEDRWATLPDAVTDNISNTMQLLKGLHAKWSFLLKSLNAKQLDREYFHPEHQKFFNIAETIGMYAWHCNHHLAHIKNAIDLGGKFD